MASNLVAYNPDDPVQQQFLASLALGETGNNPNAATEGVGGVDLSGAATDQYGFPSWSGAGNSHAAGIFQFEPATWDQLASEFNLNFQNPSDQAQGAWILAQQTYAAKSGGASLETALQSGDPTTTQGVQSALAGVWPSVTGNGAGPGGLAQDFEEGIGAELGSLFNPGGSVAAGTAGAVGGAAGAQASNGLLGAIENWFERFGLIVLGGVIIFVALWMLLSNAGVVPTPQQTAKTVSHAAAAAIA